MTRWMVLALMAGVLPGKSAAFQVRESLAGGDSYYAQCVAGPKDYSACIGYFMGIADAPVMNNGKSPEEALYCLPAGASYERHREVFHKFLRDNPQLRHVATHNLFLLAMNRAVPCRRSPTLKIDPDTGGLLISPAAPRAREGR